MIPLQQPAFRAKTRRTCAGFSLIEVSLALVVAAGGLLAIFGLFPVSLRQSKMSERDMAENAFATTLLETMAGNVRMIDDMKVWNDPDQFLRAALGDTGLLGTSTKYTAEKLHQDYGKIDKLAEGATISADSLSLSPDTVSVASGYDPKGNPDGEECIIYVGREDFEGKTPSAEKIAVPPQFLLRLAVIRREARSRDGDGWIPLWQNEDGSFKASKTSPTGRSWKKVWLPNAYIVSVVSTDGGFPETYIREPLYSQEFTFLHRP